MKIKLLIFLALLFFSVNIFGQEVMTASSKNSILFATASQDSIDKKKVRADVGKFQKRKTIIFYLNRVEIYHVKTKSKLRVLEFWDKNSNPIYELGLSDDGLICYAIQNGKTRIWNIINGLILWEGYAIRKIAFSNQAGFFVVANSSKLYFVDSYSGESFREAPISSSIYIKDMVLSEDNTKLIISTDRNFLLYDVKTAKKVKSFTANQITYTDNNKNILTLKIDDKVKVSVFDTIKYEVIRGFNSSKLMSDLNKEQRKGEKNTIFDTHSMIELISEKTKITSDGKYMMLLLNYENNKYVILCLDTEDYELVSLISTNTYEQKIDLLNYEIYDNQNLVIPMSEFEAGIYDIVNGEISNQIDYTFEEILEKKKTDINKQVKHRVVSPNYKYVALQKKDNKSNTLYARSTVVKQPSSIMNGIKFISFSNNSKYIFAKNSLSKYGYIKTMDIIADMGEGTEIMFNQFSDSLVYPKPEDIIADDPEYPDEYVFNTIERFKYIGDCDDSILVKLHIKTIATDKTKTDVQLHLLDDNGTYYYGASEAEWKFVWNKILIQSTKDNKVTNVNDFTVKEFQAADSLPNAIALVLDHSGSMGSERANQLQKAAYKFVEAKNDKDGIAIIKYDNKVGMDNKFSTDKDVILKKIKVNGLDGYGCATSLLDAVDVATSILEKEDGYARKSVVILTDGNENSSIRTKGAVLKHAVGSDINVYTVGYGIFVSEDYLKAIAHYTQGSYYKIYKSEQFNKVFNDIYKRFNNYYSINFNTTSIGDFNTYIEIALDENRKDSIITNFSNKPIDFLKLDKEDESDPDFMPFNPPIKEITFKDIDFKEFKKVGDSVEVVKVKQRDSLLLVKKMHEDSIQRVFKNIDFPNVEFYFNQTKIIEGSEKGIEQVLDFMKKNPSVEIEIQGHTDDVGADIDNEILSLERAKAVKELLVKTGIADNRISVIGYGEKKPIMKLTTEEARSVNRRVEFIIKKF